MKKHIQEAVAYLKEKGFDTPEIGIVLGTGLGKFVGEIIKKLLLAISKFLIFQLQLLNFIKES